MELYIVSERYIKYLQVYDKRVLDNHFKSHNRKYLGIALEFNGYPYFVPLSSPDKRDYFPDGKVRPSIVPIIRLSKGTGHLYGKLLCNNMIPVPESELTYYDIKAETEKNTVNGL